MRAHWFLAGLAVVSMAIVQITCQIEKPLPEQRFEVRGRVIAVNKNDGTVTLAHEAITGYMAAMTMDYPVKDKWAFDVLKPGQSLRATLVVATDRAWLEGIVVAADTTPLNGPQPSAESKHTPVGMEVPDFPLVNQDGKRIHLHQYRGKALLLTFIYTRCPLPNYCPLMSKNFAKILAEVRGDAALSPSTHLLSISIDPDYDKPAVLRAYGLECAGTAQPFDRWEFASGTPEQVRKIAEFFGLKYWSENGQIVHALVTALIGTDGKVQKVYSGNDWQPADVLANLRALHRS